MALGTGAMLLLYVSNAVTAVPVAARGFVREYSLGLSIAPMLTCVAVGLLAGLAARFAVPGGAKVRVVVALLGVWAGLAAACIYFSPTSLPDVAVLSELPFAVPILALLALGLAAGVAARVRWRRYASAQFALALPMLVPDPSVGSRLAPVPAPAAVGSVLLLGLDNVGRDGMAVLAERLTAQARAGAPDRDHGIRFLAEAVSPVPITRFAWESILFARDPGTLFGLDTLPPAARPAYFARQPFLLPRELRREGYASTYITDDAASNFYQPSEGFDELQADAVGWQVAAAWTVATAFPVAQAYLGRWRGVGITNTPGGAGTWRVFRSAARRLGAGDGQPQLVAVHAVALHGVIRPTAREVGGPLALLSHTPRELQGEDILSPLHEGPVLAGDRVVRQATLYERRRVDVLEQTEKFITELTRAGHREHSLIVVFTDHGELFYPNTQRNLPGMHGSQLEPKSLEVGAVVLLPTGRRAGLTRDSIGRHGGVVAIRGPFPVHRIAALVAEFAGARPAPADASSRGGPDAPPGGWLTAIAGGDSLPSRAIPARSVARPAMGDSAVVGGRKMLATANVGTLLRFWPDGRMSIAGEAAGMADGTADVGWTDGQWLLSYAPLARGGHLGQCYHQGRLVREWVTHTPPRHPYGGVGGSIEDSRSTPSRLDGECSGAAVAAAGAASGGALAGRGSPVN